MSTNSRVVGLTRPSLLVVICLRVAPAIGAKSVTPRNRGAVAVRDFDGLRKRSGKRVVPTAKRNGFSTIGKPPSPYAEQASVDSARRNGDKNVCVFHCNTYPVRSYKARASATFAQNITKPPFLVPANHVHAFHRKTPVLRHGIE